MQDASGALGRRVRARPARTARWPHATAASGSRPSIEDILRERNELVSQLVSLRAERLELETEIEVETIRYTKELWGKGTGADSDNLINSEKTYLVLHQVDTFATPRDGGRFGLHRSTNVKRLGKLDRGKSLLEPVRRIFAKSHERYSCRRVCQALQTKGILRCTKTHHTANEQSWYHH